MKKHLLLLILCATCCFNCFAQTDIFSRLTEIDWLQSYPVNSYIEKLFDKKEYENIQIPIEQIDTVYDRYELTVSFKGFYINFLDYHNGTSIIRYIVNENTKIHYWNYFHENGNIKLKGFTIGSGQNVGIWEKYSESGELESTIDYEENRLSFHQVHELAKKKKWLNNELEFEYSKKRESWIIKDWTKKLKYIVDSNERITIENFDKNYLDDDMILY